MQKKPIFGRFGPKRPILDHFGQKGAISEFSVKKRNISLFYSFFFIFQNKQERDAGSLDLSSRLILNVCFLKGLKGIRED